MKFAVIGARGFVGTELGGYLSRIGKSWITIVAPRLRSRASDPQSVLDDAASERAVRAQLRERFTGIDIVVNAAGLATPDGAEAEKLTGANAVLPVVAAMAARDAGVKRFVHLSSVAVQGGRPVLDESDELAPFSKYSRSKALAEQALREFAQTAAGASGNFEIVIVRANSVQGRGRPTTSSLARVARSPLSSVAGSPRPTPVTSVRHLVHFVTTVATWPDPLPPVVLQPSEGMDTAQVLRAAGGHSPVRLPAALCRAAVGAGNALAVIGGDRVRGPVRRVELMWFGQEEDPRWARENGVTVNGDLPQVLDSARSSSRRR